MLDASSGQQASREDEHVCHYSNKHWAVHNLNSELIDAFFLDSERIDSDLDVVRKEAKDYDYVNICLLLVTCCL